MINKLVKKLKKPMHLVVGFRPYDELFAGAYYKKGF